MSRATRTLLAGVAVAQLLLTACGEQETLDGCPVVELRDNCDEPDALLVRADCDDGRRIEVRRRIVDTEFETSDGFVCFVNGVETNLSDEERDICSLDLDDPADREQFLIRIREGCGFYEEPTRPFFFF
jgi:hypothetical protein